MIRKIVKMWVGLCLFSINQSPIYGTDSWGDAIKGKASLPSFQELRDDLKKELLRKLDEDAWSSVRNIVGFKGMIDNLFEEVSEEIETYLNENSDLSEIMKKVQEKPEEAIGLSRHLTDSALKRNKFLPRDPFIRALLPLMISQDSEAGKNCKKIVLFSAEIEERLTSKRSWFNINLEIRITLFLFTLFYAVKFLVGMLYNAFWAEEEEIEEELMFGPPSI